MKDKVCDLLIVGGGIVGLWLAKFAADAGLKVILVDRKACGSGASGGILGALLPHLPNAMNAKKRFQFDALVELSDLIEEIEEKSGHRTGYLRCGRIMPIRLESFGQLTDRCAAESQVNWVHPQHQFELRRIDGAEYREWLKPELMPFGLLWENLTAKVEPQALIATLKTYISTKAQIIEGFTYRGFDSATGRVRSAEDHTPIVAEKVILAAGYKTFELLDVAGLGTLGAGIKGQAVRLKLNIENLTNTGNAGRSCSNKDEFAKLPIIYDDGLYIVSHADGSCAVGSTNETEWTDEKETEPEALEPYIERARKLFFRLDQAKPVHYWAGVRPRCFGKDPMAGPVQSDKKLYAVTGGFKISFGIAHRLARAVIDDLCFGKGLEILPPTYRLSHHYQN